MKLYETKSISGDDTNFTEFTSSASDASKVRTKLKGLGHLKPSTQEVEIDPTRAGIIAFLNERMATKEV
jgi:hypothetical protein